MELLNKLKSAPPTQIFVVALVALAGLAIVLWLLSSLGSGTRGVQQDSAVSYGAPPSAKNYAAYDEMEGAMDAVDIGRGVASTIAPMPPVGGEVGADLEEYEARSYTVQFEKQNISATCNTVESLKPLPYVVFENASRADTSCRYVFKVETTHADEVVATLERLYPKEFTANTETIKRTLDVYTSRREILLRRQDLIEQSLEDAVVSYDELLALATRVEDVESVAEILNSKLRQIDMLTNRRLQVAAELEQLSRSIAEAQDRIDFTSFSVWVRQDKIVDGRAIADSWKHGAKQFAFAVNDVLQSLTFGLLENLLRIVLILIYLLIILFFAKHGWRFVREFWKT